MHYPSREQREPSTADSPRESICAFVAVPISKLPYTAARATRFMVKKRNMPTLSITLGAVAPNGPDTDLSGNLDPAFGGDSPSEETRLETPMCRFRNTEDLVCCTVNSGSLGSTLFGSVYTLFEDGKIAVLHDPY